MSAPGWEFQTEAAQAAFDQADKRGQMGADAPLFIFPQTI